MGFVIDEPVLALDESPSSYGLGKPRDDIANGGRIGHRRKSGALFEYAGLFPGYTFGRAFGNSCLRRQQESFMIDAERGDSAHCRRRNDVGGIQPSAQSDLDDAVIGRDAREREKCCRRRDFKKTGLQVDGFVEHLLEQRGEKTGRAVTGWLGRRRLRPDLRTRSK